MIIHTLTQGSQEWHAYRAKHSNASDAPAMMGCSPYKSRNELLHERHTGLAAEVDAGTQSRFDDGHRFEALARPVGENIVGETLYPVTGSLGEYSASFDGITMGGEVVLEHKTLNNEIRACEAAEQLGAHYRVQMEQQLLVSGAERCLFLATKWDNNDNLVEELHFWYEPNEALRAEIIAGWAQFATDLANYQPKEFAPKPQAEAIMQLPALAIQIRGEVAHTNLPVFKAKAEAFIASIKTELLTDEDFANAEATIKFCDSAEKSLEQAKAGAIAQTADIDELMRTVDHISAQLRDKRLLLTKTVKDKKELLKADILNKAKQAFADHVAALEKEIAPLRLVFQTRDFAGAMKNKRTLVSLHDAVDTELANGKIAIDALATAVRGRLTWYRANVGEYECLFADLQTVIQKPDEDFKLVVSSRISEHKAKEAEKLARAQAEAEATRAREAAAAQAQNEQQNIPENIPAPAPSQVTPIAAARPVAAPTTPPTLRLGQIADRLGFALTADFLASLGFAHAGRDRAAFLYHESDFQPICAALIRHISMAQAKQAKAEAERAAAEKIAKRKADLELVTIIQRYSLPIESEWRDVLEALRTRDQRLDLAVAMEDVRSDWNDGCGEVESALCRFTIRDNEDKDIANDVLGCTRDFEDGRVFRDTTWSYGALYASAADQQLAADVQTARSHARSE